MFSIVCVVLTRAGRSFRPETRPRKEQFTSCSTGNYHLIMDITIEMRCVPHARSEGPGACLLPHLIGIYIHMSSEMCFGPEFECFESVWGVFMPFYCEWRHNAPTWLRFVIRYHPRLTFQRARQVATSHNERHATGREEVTARARYVAHTRRIYAESTFNNCCAFLPVEHTRMLAFGCCLSAFFLAESRYFLFLVERKTHTGVTRRTPANKKTTPAYERKAMRERARAHPSCAHPSAYVRPTLRNHIQYAAHYLFSDNNLDLICFRTKNVSCSWVVKP